MPVIIIFMFDYWADPVVYLLLKSSTKYTLWEEMNLSDSSQISRGPSPSVEWESGGDGGDAVIDDVDPE